MFNLITFNVTHMCFNVSANCVPSWCLLKKSKQERLVFTSYRTYITFLFMLLSLSIWCCDSFASQQDLFLAFALSLPGIHLSKIPQYSGNAKTGGKTSLDTWFGPNEKTFRSVHAAPELKNMTPLPCGFWCQSGRENKTLFLHWISRTPPWLSQ